MCDYGIDSCKHYKVFGIEKIIVHSGYHRNISSVINDIALIRVAYPIGLNDWTQPLCLPFGNNRILEPNVGSLLVETGWGTIVNNFTERLETAVSLLETEKCNQHFSLDNSQICAVRAGNNPPKVCSGCPLMQEFSRKRMVLVGFATDIVRDSGNSNFLNDYTRVRSYGDWLNEQMEMK